jgi:flavin reductase (DIM6/NTAB) family NADH-FMN oxidoreductase RutF
MCSFEPMPLPSNFFEDDQQDLSACFNKALSNKWEHVTAKTGLTGAPVLLPALAVLECHPYAQHHGQDQVIVVGRVEHSECQERSSAPVYFHGRYHELTSTTLDARGEAYALFLGDQDGVEI